MRTDNLPPIDKFETETCSRCGGSGQYSYCQMWGTVCFKCHGKGRVYTTRGQIARTYFAQIRSKSLKDFKHGELVWMEDGIFKKSQFMRVTEIKPDELNAGLWIIETTDASFHASPDTLMMQGFDAETKAKLLRRALDFQQTLTKRGTARVK